MTFAQSLAEIKALLPASHSAPRLAIVCGSGLSTLVDTIVDPIAIPYCALTGFGESTVPGHHSALVFGFIAAVPIVAQLGRFHAYEGFTLEEIIYPMRVFHLLGVESVVLTNAAGGLDPGMAVGTIVVLQDHLALPSLTSWNPLIGKNRSEFGERFPPMSDAYDFELRKAAFRAAHELGFKQGTLVEGTYAWVAGPTYETRAEQRFLRAAGAHVVGMSTVPEVIAARHAGIRVLVLSLCTNIVVNNPYRSAERAVIAERSSLASTLQRDVFDQQASKIVEQEEKDQLSHSLSKDDGAKNSKDDGAKNEGGEENDEGEEQSNANHNEVLEVGKLKAETMRKLVEKIIGDLPPRSAPTSS